MGKLGIILGAGFSFYAELPMAEGINSYFKRENKKQLLHFSSDEWKWYDLADYTHRNNGSINYDRIVYGYILDQLVLRYGEISEKFNYEDFYQFILDLLGERGKLEEISIQAFQNFRDNNEVSEDSFIYERYEYLFDNPQRDQVKNMLNYLIGDLLYCRKSLETFSTSYENFFSFINSYPLKDIFTLNHDFLLERLFQFKGVKYSDGFSTEGSCLQYRDNKIRCFNGKFSQTNIIKLHGSVDLYKYICSKEDDGNIITNGEIIYFKTHDYYEKQSPVRIDIKTGEIVQKFHWNITPQFITGTNKVKLIERDSMYSELYNEFKNRIKLADTLLIVGYSYSDDHINSELESALTSESLTKIINVNPNLQFPYSVKGKTVINLNNINELIHEEM